ncbi:Dot/Icm T4SS effector Ceg19 [Legionella quateirensis]|uniref:Coiled-coil protein n=1 Tax=Legionella quateirensis TaxID=45072 RepID=A0A378KVC4_9GAMM|nr:Dot/Icm T4SS effector Ceg19 [Legionella quateirensis]KTD43260.1 coiled-coil protein [Legionella quateirensis]STY18139.1 coiled-coil protein [Legionella quateirensis]
MHKLLELEQEFKDLVVIVDNALASSLISEKENALEQFRNSELSGIDQGSMIYYAHQFGPTVRLINITKNLPVQIAALEKKIRLIEIQLTAENTSIQDIAEIQTEPRVEPITTVMDPVPEETQSVNPRSVAIERFRESLRPYIDATSSRTTEYSWGLIEYAGSFFGLSGYSKSEKLAAIDHLLEQLEHPENRVLCEKDKAVLNTGTLSSGITPWLNDPTIGADLNELLTAGHTIENKLS